MNEWGDGPFEENDGWTGGQPEEPLYEENEEEAYEQPVYEQPVYEEPYEPYGQPEPDRKPQPTILSTNLTVNLICTLASMLGVFGLFLYFADKRSQAVHRYAVQSTGLLAVFVFVSLLLWVCALAFSWIPLLGWLLAALFNVARLAVVCANAVVRVQMMLHAYRGEAYVLPFIGEKLRAFE